jgi:hypothetical protein
MDYDQKQWVAQILFEHNYDLSFNVKYPASRVDVKSINGHLWSVRGARNGMSSTTRQNSTLALFKQAYELSTKPNFECVFSTEDVPRTTFLKPYFCYSTHSKTPDDYSKVIPDYTFDSMNLNRRYELNEIQYDSSYVKLIDNIIKAGNEPPLTDKAGWCGNLGVWDRVRMVELHKTFPLCNLAEIIQMSWEVKDPNFPSMPKNFMTIPDQVLRWRYLIDIRGNGWSDRVKCFYFSNRLMFRIIRPHNEFYDKNLIPWVHYVPVQHVDRLAETITQVKGDLVMENEIKANALKFANENLLQNHAIEYFRKIIDETNWAAEAASYKQLHVTVPDNLNLLGFDVEFL